MFSLLEFQYQPVTQMYNSTLKICDCGSHNMASIIVDTGNWTLEYVAEIYTKQTMLSKEYKHFLSKYNYHDLRYNYQ